MRISRPRSRTDSVCARSNKLTSSDFWGVSSPRAFYFFCRLLTIAPALLVFSTPAHANPEEDLKIIFRGDENLPPPGGIAGRVINTSNRVYSCVDLVFRLIYNSGASGPAEQRITLRDLQPDSTTHYSAPLKEKAGFGLKTVASCDPAERPDPIPDTSTCTVTGSVASTVNFSGLDDRGTSHKIKNIYLLNDDGELVSRTQFHKAGASSKTSSGKTRKTQYFQFVRVPANHSYQVQLDYAWRTEPDQLSFSCPNDRGKKEFSLPRLHHIGNRLGG